MDAQRVVACAGEHARAGGRGGGAQRQKRLALGPYLIWGREAVGGMEQSRLGPGSVWSSSGLFLASTPLIWPVGSNAVCLHEDVNE